MEAIPTLSLYERYRKIRQEHGPIPARMAITWARVPDRDGIDLYDLQGTGRTIERDGFSINLSWDYDQYADLSYIGEWSDSWEEGCFDSSEGREGDSRTYRYFHPATAYREVRDYLHKSGADRHTADCTAREYQKRDYTRMQEYNNQEWGLVVLRVTASRKGIELGTASFCGVESDAGGEHIAECFDDLIAEAIEEARENLDALCKR